MPERSFPGLAALIAEVEAQAAERPDPLLVVAALLKLIIASDADPYLMTGLLVEGIAGSIANNIPPERQGEVAVEVVRLLRERLCKYGTI